MATDPIAPNVHTQYSALGDPVRCRIVALLANGEMSANELSEPFSISRPAVSRHLRVLRESGLARARVQGRTWMYSIDPGNLAKATAWLAEVNEMWSRTLGAFKKYVEEQ